LKMYSSTVKAALLAATQAQRITRNLERIREARIDTTRAVTPEDAELSQARAIVRELGSDLKVGGPVQYVTDIHKYFLKRQEV
jgi:hypothetical protein